MKDEFFTQCKLRTPCPNGVTERVSYIQSKHAEIGFTGTFDDDNRIWEVIEVHPSTKARYSTIKDKQHKSDDIWAATSGSVVIGHK